MNPNKYICDCGHRGTVDDRLEIKDPRYPTHSWWACPGCMDIGDMSGACEVDDCWEETTCGFVAKSGVYVQTCGKHMRELE